MKRTSTSRLTSIGFFLLAVLFAVLLFVLAESEESTAKLVEAKWLEKNLSVEKLRIVDVREDVKDYWRGHIPGAVYLNPEALRWPERGVPVKLIPPATFVQLLGEMGIDEETIVVTYSEKGDYNATYFVWALDYVGHSGSAVLDGGFEAWKKQGGPTTQEYPQIQPTDYGPPAELNEGVRATVEDVKNAASQEDIVLLDVRPLEMYEGSKGFWKRKGHMRGAVHHFAGDDVNDDGTWKNKDELRASYETVGASPDKRIIVSCGSGMLSSQAYFTLRHILGYPMVENYEGSFSEWSNVNELPVETGVGATVNPEEVLEQSCTACHTLKRIHRVERDASGWEKTIARMVQKGAKLTEAEGQALVEYLSKKGK